MAKWWSKKFYQSSSWIKARDCMLAKYNYICQKCKANPAEIVHHIIWLTPQNINDPNITLGEDNLLPVCRECHAKIHEGVSATIDNLKFDKEGNLIEI